MKPKLGQGLGYNPDAIEVIVWRTAGGIWQQAHDPSWRLRLNARHDRHAFATNKPVVKSARRRLRTKGLERARTPGRAATSPGNSRMNPANNLGATGGGRGIKKMLSNVRHWTKMATSL